MQETLTLKRKVVHVGPRPVSYPAYSTETVIKWVVDPDDPHTQLRQGWVQQRAEASELLVSGEALSHCVANTVRDLVDAWGTDARRVTLLTDTCSSVGGFEAVGERFVEDLTSRGMKLATTETWHR